MSSEQHPAERVRILTDAIWAALKAELSGEKIDVALAISALANVSAAIIATAPEDVEETLVVGHAQVMASALVESRSHLAERRAAN